MQDFAPKVPARLGHDVLCWYRSFLKKNKNMRKEFETNLTFVGMIDKVVKDFTASDEPTNRSGRLFLKMICYDDELNEMSVYCRVQGRKAQRVLEAMDEYGNVEGLWMARLHPNVKEYPGTDRTIFANLLHCKELEMIDEEFKPVTIPVEPLLCPGRSTGIMNWMKNVFAN